MAKANCTERTKAMTLAAPGRNICTLEISFKKKTFQVAAPTHQNTLIFWKNNLCSVVMAYLIPRENKGALTSGRFHDGTEMHMCLRVRLNVTWILRNCFHNIHPLTGQRRLKQLGHSTLNIRFHLWSSSIETYCFRLAKNFGKNNRKNNTTRLMEIWWWWGWSAHKDNQTWICELREWWNLSRIQRGRHHLRWGTLKSFKCWSKATVTENPT